MQFVLWQPFCSISVIRKRYLKDEPPPHASFDNSGRNRNFESHREAVVYWGSPLHSVLRGFRLLLYGYGLAFVIFCLLVLCVFISDADLGVKKPQRLLALTIGMKALFASLLCLVYIVALYFCLRAPRLAERNMAGIATASMVLACASIVAMFCNLPPLPTGEGRKLSFRQAVSAPDIRYEMPAICHWLGSAYSVLAAVGVICFILFCRRLGRNIGSAIIVKRATTTLNWFLIFQMYMAVFTLITYYYFEDARMTRTTPSSYWITGTKLSYYLGRVFGIVWFLKYISLLRNEIRELTFLEQSGPR